MRHPSYILWNCGLGCSIISPIHLRLILTSFVRIYISCVDPVHFGHRVQETLKHILMIKRSQLYIIMLGASLHKPGEMHFICTFMCNGLLLEMWMH